MAKYTYDSIMSELKNGVFRPVYYLMGEEGYFTDRITGYIIENQIEMCRQYIRMQFGEAAAENALIYDDHTSQTKLFGGIAFWGYQCIYEKNGVRYMTENIDPLHFDIVNDTLVRKGV